MTLSPAGHRLLEELALHGTHLGIEHFERLLHALGDPQTGLPVTLVAGTNGKGSTAACLAGIATASGYRTGLYTSPHLEEVEERIRVQGRAIDGSRLSELLSEVLAAAGEEEPTYFEALTAAAFLHFREARVELAVLEVGLGGRLDATNVSDPALSLITDISLDHQQFLGASLQAIATEKAGILRSGRTAIIGMVPAAAHRAIDRRSREIGARLLWSEEEIVEASSESGGGERVVLQTKRERYRYRLSLAGEHQRRNLALAILAAEELGVLGWERIDRDSIQRGAANTTWPGRLERVTGPRGERVLLDVAHNPGGVEALARHLALEGEPRLLLFGALEDKDVASMLPSLAALSEGAILTLPESDRGREPEELVALCRANGLNDVEVKREIQGALERALEKLEARPGALLVICGSTYVVGPARRLLRQRWDRPVPALDLWPARERT